MRYFELQNSQLSSSGLYSLSSSGLYSLSSSGLTRGSRSLPAGRQAPDCPIKSDNDRTLSGGGNNNGFTIIEVLISTAIIAVLVAGIALFTRDIFLMNDAFREAILTEQQAGPVIKEMIAEIRTASQSSVGSYPIEAAATSTFTFYANIDSDAYKERVRYFREDSALKKGILKPSGYPLSYLPVNEKVRPVVRYLAATTTPLFLYYDQTYAGTTSPLIDPVDILKIRLVEVRVIVDKDPVKLPEPQIFESQTAIRNLKDAQ